MRPAVRGQMALIGALIGQLPQQPSQQLEYSFHTSSGRSLESTNGDSLTVAVLVPRRIPAQMRIESIRIVATSTKNRPQSAASSRALKINVLVWPASAPVTAPDRSAASRLSACARNPTAGNGEKIFWYPAVKHTTTSHARGTQVIHMYLAPCIFSTIVVATHRAIAASN